MIQVQRPYLANYLTFYHEYLPRIKEAEHKRWLSIEEEEEEEHSEELLVR